MFVSFQAAEFGPDEDVVQLETVETVFADYGKCLTTRLKPGVNEI